MVNQQNTDNTGKNPIKNTKIQKLISKFPRLYIILKSDKTNLKNLIINIKGYKAIKTNKLLDKQYYLKKNTDVETSGKDPILHYLYQGSKEGRKPNPTFDGNYYLKKYEDVRKLNINPLIHYALYGKKEKRKTIEKEKISSKMTNPKISIITASYNYANLIEKGINSIINQTYKNWELIIVDDGSTDNSIEVIKNYTNNKKIKLYQHENGENKGLKETLLLGLKHTTGEFVAFLEADDWLENNYLEEKIKVLRKYPDVKLIFNDVEMFSDEKNFDFSWYNSYLKSQKNILSRNNSPFKCDKYFVKHNFIPTFSCVLTERKLLLSCDFNTPKDPALDFWIFRQIALKTEFYYINKKLTHWMMHKDSYINDIFTPETDFDGFEDITTKEDYINSFYKKNPNVESNSYIKKSNRYFKRSEEDVKLITFYLPQFHTIKENNKWWGNGFTEWTNVSKAQPQFIGHYQPQLPDELGFYDLTNPNVMEKQVEMAKKYGIYGFCFHYYWFSGKRLLEKPIFDYLNNKKLDFPFMLCWANESWTRTWTSFKGEVLMPQSLEEEDYLKFIEDIMPFFKDDRYIKINNKPVLIVYRPHTFSKDKLNDAIKIWRSYVKKQGFDDLYILNTRTDLFKDNPLDWGINATVEFPPNDMVKIRQADNLKFLNPDFNGKYF